MKKRAKKKKDVCPTRKVGLSRYGDVMIIIKRVSGEIAVQGTFKRKSAMLGPVFEERSSMGIFLA